MVELGQRAGALHSGRAAADDDDVERTVLGQRLVLVRGFPSREDVLLEAHRIGERVHRERVLGGTGGSEEVDLGAEREHEVVVGQRRHLGELDLALVQVDPGDGVQVDTDVRLLVEEVAQRMSDRRPLEQGGRDLVEERLEGVVVVLVDQHDVDVGLLQRLRGAEPGEASAEDQDARAPSLGFTRHSPPANLGGRGRLSITQAG